MEKWICEQYNVVQKIDNVDYIEVYRPELPSRVFLMRKDALQKTNN